MSTEGAPKPTYEWRNDELVPPFCILVAYDSEGSYHELEKPRIIAGNSPQTCDRMVDLSGAIEGNIAEGIRLGVLQTDGSLVVRAHYFHDPKKSRSVVTRIESGEAPVDKDNIKAGFTSLLGIFEMITLETLAAVVAKREDDHMMVVHCQAAGAETSKLLHEHPDFSIDRANGASRAEGGTRTYKINMSRKLRLARAATQTEQW